LASTGVRVAVNVPGAVLNPRSIWDESNPVTSWSKVTSKVTAVALLVGLFWVGSTVMIGTGAWTWTSTDPMSAPAPDGRGSPRWSTERPGDGDAVLRAGLSDAGSWVRVGPPLSASAPSLASSG